MTMRRASCRENDIIDISERPSVYSNARRISRNGREEAIFPETSIASSWPLPAIEVMASGKRP